MLQNNDCDKIDMLNKESLPTHIAIIMDGNGRWAQKKGLPRTFGHRKGMETLERTVEAAISLGIKYLTVYAFSTENWKRPSEEVGMLMNLLIEFVDKKIAVLDRQGVRIRHIGIKENISAKVYEKIRYAEEKTAHNNRLVLNIAFNYGSRQEITAAVQKIAEKVQSGELMVADITPETVSGELMTKGEPDPDLLIRTGGEMRISNYLLWQIAYSEIYVTDIFWPDFTQDDLIKALLAYQKRDRRFGGLDKQWENEF